jgi:hypothetical protein
MRKKILTIGAVFLLLASICTAEQILVYRFAQEALKETGELISLIKTDEIEEAEQKTAAAWN